MQNKFYTIKNEIKILISVLVISSCVNPFPQNEEKQTIVDSNGGYQAIENNISNNNNHEIEPVDKLNVIESNNTILNATYNVSLAIPRKWKSSYGQAEHTILKVIYQYMGAQVSLIRLKEKFNSYTETELDGSLSELISNMASAGITLQNAKEIETTCLGYRAKRIDANYMLHEGELSIVENYIAISFVKDGALYTLSATFPQKLSGQLMRDIDQIFNSIQFNQ